VVAVHKHHRPHLQALALPRQLLQALLLVLLLGPLVPLPLSGRGLCSLARQQWQQ
jgi:hypothetical protein